MENVQFTKDEKGNGSFFILDGDKKIAEMVIHEGTNHLTVYHTEVQPEAEGKGLAKELLNAMVSYVRERHYKLIPLCVYVAAQVKRHPEDFADILQA
ncbi:GNAT family N-acetyltransferase [Filimonas lacunae]|nr:GNAT family N-acetyltransferase [Filimonas lacunae]BAV07980.1 acetyltransferase [Filimonas lacunae]